MVAEITSKADFDAKVTNAPGRVVLDFHATWCGPCKAIAPLVEKLDTDHADVKFYKIDVDQVPDVAAELGVSAMPTFLFFKDGKKQEVMVRGANPPALQAAVAQLAA